MGSSLLMRRYCAIMGVSWASADIAGVLNAKPQGRKGAKVRTPISTEEHSASAAVELCDRPTMNATNLLERVRIASPCPMRWDDMTGDDRARFCARCSKHVYNFSAMTTAEAEALIVRKEGRLCGAYFQRTDGTTLTADCPVGVELGQDRRSKRLVAAAVAALITVACVFSGDDAGSLPDAGSNLKERMSAKLDAAVWTVKGWFGFKRPLLMVAGEIAIMPPPPPAPIPAPPSP